MKSIIALIVLLILFGLLHALKQKGYNFTVRVLVATVLGVILGLVFKGSTSYVGLIGRIYANLLKCIVVPLLFFSVIHTVSSLEDWHNLTSVGGKTLGILSIHNILGSITAIIFCLIFNIGENASFSVPEGAEVKQAPSLEETILSFFPKNIIDDAAHNRVIPIIVFSLLIGLAVLLYDDKKQIKAFTDFIAAGNRVIYKAIGLITQFTPYAVMALIADHIGEMDLKSAGSLVLVLGVVYLACIFHSVVNTSGMIGLIGKLNPVPFLKKFFSAWMVAFSTQSSVGSIPASVEAQQNMGVPETISNFAASIGTTFGMPGCAAIWPVTLAIFTKNALGIHYGVTDYLMLILTALLVSIGTVGVPGTATITATSLFTAMGLPVEMVLVMTPISAIADMARTATNVEAGGSTGVIVASLEGKLDKEKYYR